VPTTPVVGAQPANVAVTHPGAGTVFFGANSISVPVAKATVNLNGSNVVFNTGSRPATAITLGSGVSITADPTAPAGIALAAMAISPAQLTATLLPTTVATTTFDSAGAVNAGHVSTALNNLSANAGLVGAVNSSPVLTALGNAGSVANGIVNTANAAANSFTSASTSNVLSGSSNSTSAAANNFTVNAANAAALTPVMYSAPAGASSWISDTELTSGRIPAVMSSDEDFGITPDVSTVVEMEEQDEAALPEAGKAMMVKPGMPLTGSVSSTANGVKTVSLKRGSVVFAPSRDTLVNTPFGTVKIDAKSIVLIMSFRHGLSVFDLADAHGKAVVVQAGKHDVVLNPGMHVSITRDSVGGFEQINPAQLIGYGNINERRLGEGMKAFTSEFSVPLAVSAVSPLRQLVNSKHPNAQRVSKHMLKTAAILTQIHNAKYEQIMRPALTAYQNPADAAALLH
jgi:hypothetical protein